MVIENANMGVSNVLLSMMVMAQFFGYILEMF